MRQTSSVEMFYHPSTEQQKHLKEIGHLVDELANKDLQCVKEDVYNENELLDNTDVNEMEDT